MGRLTFLPLYSWETWIQQHENLNYTSASQPAHLTIQTKPGNYHWCAWERNCLGNNFLSKLPISQKQRIMNPFPCMQRSIHQTVIAVMLGETKLSGVLWHESSSCLQNPRTCTYTKKSGFSRGQELVVMKITKNGQIRGKEHTGWMQTFKTGTVK